MFEMEKTEGIFIFICSNALTELGEMNFLHEQNSELLHLLI